MAIRRSLGRQFEWLWAVLRCCFPRREHTLTLAEPDGQEELMAA